MMKARLLDHMGYVVVTVMVPKPITFICAWGNRAFLLNMASLDTEAGCVDYIEKTVFVVPDTAAHGYELG